MIGFDATTIERADMPTTVTVKLIYTPRPEGNETTVRVGGGDYYPIEFDSEYGSGEVLAAVPLNTTAVEAIAVAQALTLVAGCADTRWRGWHWEARDADGKLLACTPPGQWYAEREDCERAVTTLFGDRSEVVMGPGAPMPGGAVMVLVLREPTPDPIDRPTIKPELTVHALRDIAKLHAPVKLRGDDRSVCADCGGFYPCPTVALIPETITTTTPDADPDEYPAEHPVSGWPESQAHVLVDPRIHAGSMRPGDYPLPTITVKPPEHTTPDADPEYPVGSVEG